MTVQQRIKPAPITWTGQVPLAPAAAFDLFLGRMHQWWMPAHSLLKVPVKEIVIEPRPGGRWYEIGTDGSQEQWGKVVEWDPPHRALLHWQLNADFTFDPGLETEVEISFTPHGDGTRVAFEHRNLELFGERAEELRSGMGGGWSALLDGFVARAKAEG